MVKLSTLLAYVSTATFAVGTNSVLPASNCQVQPYNNTVPDQTFDVFDQRVADIYRYRQQRAVNLGSWFVHESWITPSLFTCATEPKVSELDIANGWGTVNSARALLERHWDTFIISDDFKYLADKGINTVRLPIGYWNLGPSFLNGTIFEPVASVYKDSWIRVKRAIKQAAEHGIGVLVDLHATPGSQNGKEHSGVSDGVVGLFSNEFNINRTKEILQFMTKELAGINNVVGIQILNEPQYTDSLEEFYIQAIDVVRNSTPLAKTLPVYLHDGFDLDRLSHFVSQREDFVVHDHHAYYIFDDAASKPAPEHVDNIGNQVSASLTEVANRQRGNLIVGEWSCALTPKSLENEKDVNAAQKAFCEQQLNVYSNVSAGWAFWTYMKDDCYSDTGWCFKSALGKSLPSSFLSMNKLQPRRFSRSVTKMSQSLLRPFSDPRRFSLIQTRRLTKVSSSEDRPSIRGYLNGFATAQAFSAAHSTLGFAGQYIADHMPTDTQQGGTNGDYKAGFLQGLQAGEALFIS